MFYKIKKIIIKQIINNPEYIEFKKKLIKLKKDLKNEIKELTQELDEHNTKRKSIFINELICMIIIGFIIWISLNILLINYGYMDVPPVKFKNIALLDMSLKKRDWFKKFIFEHNNEKDMKNMAAKIYKEFKKKDLDLNDDEIIKNCLDFWRRERKKWDKNFKIFRLPFEKKFLKKKKKKKKKEIKERNILQILKDYYKKK